MASMSPYPQGALQASKRQLIFSLIYFFAHPHPPSVCYLYLRVSYGLSPSLSVCNCFSSPSLPPWSSVKFLKFYMSEDI